MDQFQLMQAVSKPDKKFSRLEGVKHQVFLNDIPIIVEAPQKLTHITPAPILNLGTMGLGDSSGSGAFPTIADLTGISSPTATLESVQRMERVSLAVTLGVVALFLWLRHKDCKKREE